MILDLEKLKTLPPVKAHCVPVPELGGEAWVAELTADERDLRLEIGWDEHKKAVALERKARGLANGSGQHSPVDDSNVGLRAWVVAACLCDESRNFLCKDVIAISQTCEALGALHSGPVTRLFAKAQEVNGVSAEQLEAIEKN